MVPGLILFNCEIIRVSLIVRLRRKILIKWLRTSFDLERFLLVFCLCRGGHHQRNFFYNNLLCFDIPNHLVPFILKDDDLFAVDTVDALSEHVELFIKLDFTIFAFLPSLDFVVSQNDIFVCKDMMIKLVWLLRYPDISRTPSQLGHRLYI